MKNFLDQDFLLQTDTARELYHEHAAKMPIIDYHCHLDPRQIAENHQFEDLTEIWLGGDHYKWRAMRANGIPEEYITGDKPLTRNSLNGQRRCLTRCETRFIIGHIWNLAVYSESIKS